MARVRRSSIIAVEENDVETEQDKKNFAIIQKALLENGPDYRIVQQLCQSVIRPGATAGKSVVKQLIHLLCDVQDMQRGIKIKVDKKTKKQAIHGLMKLNRKAFNGLEQDLRMAFLHNSKDATIALGCALLIASHFKNDEVTEWFSSNMKEDDVWSSVFYNIATGAFVFDGKAVAFKGLDSVFNGLYAKMKSHATMKKLKMVFTNNPFLNSTLTIMTEGGNSALLVNMMKLVGEKANAENINDVADILRELNGWSATQFRKINATLAENIGPGFFPGIMTFTTIDIKIPDIIFGMDNKNTLGYSFRKYIEYMVKRSLIVKESEDYPNAGGLKSALKDYLADMNDAVKDHEDYARKFERFFIMAMV
jgi:hypothetical protein